MFVSWLSGLPGDAERLWEESSRMGRQIVFATIKPRERVVARGVTGALRASVGEKALSCPRDAKGIRNASTLAQGIQT